MEGITHDRPETSYKPDIVGEYHLPKSADQVRCSYCEKRTPHRNGFVVRFRPPSLHLIGSDCGQTKFNLHFGVAKRAHQELVDRQGYFRRLETIVERTPLFLAVISEMLHGDHLKQVERASLELYKNASDAFTRLQSRTLLGEPLTENVKVRDLDAERRRDERLPEDRKGGPIYKYERLTIGRLQGTAVLHPGHLRKVVHEFKKALDELPRLFRQDTNDIPTKHLRTSLIELEKFRGAAEDAFREIAAAPRFFDGANLDVLARWSENESRDRLLNDGGQLVAINGEGKRFSVTPIPRSAIPTLPSLLGDESTVAAEPDEGEIAAAAE